GARTCIGATLTACSARTPQNETCNGLDDDCDTIVDEGGSALCPDDALPCTSRVCRGDAGCGFDLASASCLISGTCGDAGDVSPVNRCAACDPLTSASGWTAPTDRCGTDGGCFDAGVLNPATACEWCDPVTRTDGFSANAQSCSINGACYPAGASNPA